MQVSIPILLLALCVYLFLSSLISMSLLRDREQTLRERELEIEARVRELEMVLGNRSASATPAPSALGIGDSDDHASAGGAVADSLPIVIEHDVDSKCDLRQPLCSFSEPMYLTYIPGGGFNNQRQSLERALQVCHLLGRVLVVRDIYVDPKHNPQSVFSGSFLPVDNFFDLLHLESVSNVSIIRYHDFKKEMPALAMSPTVMKGIFSHSEIWTDSLPCHSSNPVLDIQGHPLAESALYPIVESLSCRTDRYLEVGLIGMNRFWRTQRATRELAQQSVRFASSIRHLASNAIKELGGRDLFSCVHFRQGDKLSVSPREYNYTADDVAQAIQSYVKPDEPVYVATDAPADALVPFVRELGERRIQSAFTLSTLRDREQFKSNDYLGCVEVEICSSARLFFASSSTFSASILNQRHGVSGITQWEVDRTTNFPLKRVTASWKLEAIKPT